MDYRLKTTAITMDYGLSAMNHRLKTTAITMDYRLWTKNHRPSAYLKNSSDLMVDFMAGLINNPAQKGLFLMYLRTYC